MTDEQMMGAEADDIQFIHALSATQDGQTFRALLYGHVILLQHYRSQMNAYMSTSERSQVNASFRQQVWSLVPILRSVACV
ncbi:unnamed protein product [Rotaria sp. Silwood1]|nr:unnamed protein product [Rotaria sp. Silwood1]CAF4730947.1 unnamed protein product [Rotaria sp. Silwood1]CAF4894666.1 unnamed protein product [Rotaria sp. Silwood1]